MLLVDASSRPVIAPDDARVGEVAGGVVSAAAHEALRRQLHEARSELETFARAVSHDLQEPLRAISSSLRSLGKSPVAALDDRVRAHLENASEGASRLDAQLMALVDYSRVTTRAKPMVRVDTEAVVARAQALAGKRIAETGATVLHTALAPVIADEAQLARVFQALLDNALKFRRAEPPVVTITQERASRGSSHDEPPEWIFSIIDNGVGFEPHYAERIFGLFERLHARDAYQGAGMGLALCKRIVARHGGRMWANSAVGRGSTFLFSLPEPQ